MKKHLKLIKFLIKALVAFWEVFSDYFEEDVKEIGNSEEDINIQKCYFPMEYLRITQNENEGTHLGSLAMDFGGKDTSKEWCFAPCDLRVVRIREDVDNCGEIYFESLSPVLFADGTTDYLHLLMIHDNNSASLKKDDIVYQGEKFYREGGKYKGDVDYYAAHVHIEAGKGKWKSPYHFPNLQNVYVTENQEHLYNLFWLKHGTKNLNDTKGLFTYEN